MSLAIESADPRPFPFGLGWHPFVPRDAATRLGFRATGVWTTDATRLPARRVPCEGAWRFDPPRPLEGVALDNVFTGWDGRVDVACPRTDHALAIDADAALAFLVVYVPAGRDFFAVEPVTHMTDAFNRAARGEAGTGTRILDPGASYSCTMRLCCAPLRQGPAR
jgi:aldose 1-epimerase